MTDQLPRSIAFRFDGPESDVRAVLAMLAELGAPIAAHHAPRPKRQDPGVFWDGRIGVPDDAPPVQAEATRLNPDRAALRGDRTALPRRRRSGR